MRRESGRKSFSEAGEPSGNVKPGTLKLQGRGTRQVQSKGAGEVEVDCGHEDRIEAGA